MVTIEFKNGEEMLSIIEDQASKGMFLHDTQYLFEGNFLIFKDHPLVVEDIPETEITLENRVSELENVVNTIVLGGI